jgi:two-component system, NtrC family, response regulator AtoC
MSEPKTPPFAYRIFNDPAQTEPAPLHRSSRKLLLGRPPIVTVASFGGKVPTRSTFIEDQGRASSPGEGMHVLVMSPDSFNTHPLPKTGAITIGRSGKSQIVVDDPMASREHLRIHVDDVHGAYHVEDMGSANGTRVRDAAIVKGALTPISPGEAITIGSTVLMVQQNRSALQHQRLWSHAYFETRLEAECGRGDTAGGRFALVRLRLERSLPWTKLAPVLAREVPTPNVFAAYGPNDYEILLLEQDEAQVAALVEHLRAELAAADIPSRSGIANYPRDGRNVDALLAHANACLRPAQNASKPASAASATTVARQAYGPGMQRVHEMALRVAGATINVLILGETGVGKEVMANMLHRLSPRADKAFVALNCAGLTESLIESELFGHERGAFTGAVGNKVGLIESADGGTLFLDEVGELSLSVQSKLLRVLETRQVTRVGALKPKLIDVRFVSATNRDLEQEVIKGTFRRDLFFRLNGISLSIPPLRERPTEIPSLAATFMATYCRDNSLPAPTLSEDVVDLLVTYSWPGNIRELKNVMERAVVLSDGTAILAEHLPREKMSSEPHTDRPTPSDARARIADLSPQDQSERQRMVDALALYVGNQTRAAAALGMPRRTFVAKLDRYGIPRPQKTS